MQIGTYILHQSILITSPIELISHFKITHAQQACLAYIVSPYSRPVSASALLIVLNTNCMYHFIIKILQVIPVVKARVSFECLYLVLLSMRQHPFRSQLGEPLQPLQVIKLVTLS